MKTLLVLLFLSGCSHSYFYTPEIAGKGEMQRYKGEIEYQIPTGISLTLRSLGIKKRHDMAMLGMRMTFERTGSSPAFLDAAEQILRLGDSRIKATLVRSKTRKLTVVDLSRENHVVIELLYPLPKFSEGDRGIETFGFEWRVHYGNGKSETQTARFDRQDGATQQAGSVFARDLNYPYDRAPVEMPGWTIDEDPLWWPMGPW